MIPMRVERQDSPPGMPVAKAREVIARFLDPVTTTERLGVRAALGRVLAEDLIAPNDVPPFTRAGMDGYAVRADDTAGATRTAPRLLRAIEQIFTGQMPNRAVAAGTCAEIATGAPMPEGADAVVMVEETMRDADGTVRVFAPVAPRQNVGRQGADIAAGSTVLAAGTFLNATGKPNTVVHNGVTNCESCHNTAAWAGGGRHREAGSERLREAARGDSLDGQRDRRAGPAARTGPDPRHQPLHALWRRAPTRRPSGGPSNRR